MKLPKNIDPIEFYNAAKKQGIKIQSRFNHIYAYKGVRMPIRWCAEIRRQKNNKKVTILKEFFPFTIEGELEAAEFIKRNENFISSYKI